MRKIIDFVSQYDGSPQKAVLIAPPNSGEATLPLVIVPHAAFFSAEKTADYWHDLPAKRGVIAVFPFGHGRKREILSLGWRAQISDLASMPYHLEKLGYAVDRSRIFSVGISMGGMESLLLAAFHPEMLAGVFTFNAVTDLGSWYSASGVHQPEVADEVGGTPDRLPGEYAERSPMSFPATIAQVPVMLYWDPNDAVVPEQTQKQSGLLIHRVKEADPDALIWGETHTHGHFWIRPTLALDWLLDRKCGV